MSAGQKSCSVAVHWALIVRDRARYHTIEQRLIDIMILGCLSFFFLARVVEAQCRNKKSGKVQAWTIRHQIAQPIRSTVLYRLSQIPRLHVQKKNERFIGEFRRRLSYRYRKPRRMLIMDKRKPYDSSQGFSRVFFAALGLWAFVLKISFHVLLSYPGQPFSF